jgi:hypothetical protein
MMLFPLLLSLLLKIDARRSASHRAVAGRYVSFAKNPGKTVP